ncbi:unnamed protein product, partial [Adineta ricciae]
MDESLHVTFIFDRPIKQPNILITNKILHCIEYPTINIMNSSNVAPAKEILKQGEMECEDVDAHIEDVNAHFEDVSQQVLRNDIWDALKADEIAEASLQVSAETVDSFAGDAQSHLFGQFLSIATNFASLPFAENLHRIPELVESITGLLEEMMKEVREYSDMASEFRDLIQCFVQM